MDIVGLEHYMNSADQFGGFGNSSQEEVNYLLKALSAGDVTGRDVTDSISDSGAPLKVESLEKNLKHLEYKLGDIVLYNDIPKLPAYNTVEEYNQLVSYGTERGGFYAEGGLPDTEDSVYRRRAELIKFAGVTREVTHPMTLVKTNVGDIIEKETQNGMLWLLRTINRALLRGNEDNVPVQINGLQKQHMRNFATPSAYYDGELVIDLRGEILQEDTIEEASQIITDNYGDVSDLYAPPVVLSNFTKFFYPNLRQYAPVQTDTTVGRRVSKFQSQFGDIGLKFDKFMNQLPTKSSTSAAVGQNPPSAPVPAATALAAVASVGKGVAGDYWYVVSAVNAGGESAVALYTAAAAAAVTVAANGAVDITLAQVAGATAYNVYRSNVDPASAAGATYYYVGTVSEAERAAGYDGGAAGVIRDKFHILGNTNEAWVLQNSVDIWSIKQLAPMMKMNLAVVQPSFRWMILCYMLMHLYQPNKVVRIINIGTTQPA